MIRAAGGKPPERGSSERREKKGAVRSFLGLFGIALPDKLPEPNEDGEIPLRITT